AFSAPARSALVSQVVPVELLANAMTWNSSGWQVASMLGPSLSGLIIALTHTASWAYALTALAITCTMLLVAGVRPRSFVRSAEAPSLRSLLAGLRFVWRTKVILATITLDLFAVLFGGATALLPIFAKDIL